jgi:hypothetical protein
MLMMARNQSSIAHGAKRQKESIGFGDFIHDATLPYYSAAICTAVLAFLPTVETR